MQEVVLQYVKLSHLHRGRSSTLIYVIVAYAEILSVTSQALRAKILSVNIHKDTAATTDITDCGQSTNAKKKKKINAKKYSYCIYTKFLACWQKMNCSVS